MAAKRTLLEGGTVQSLDPKIGNHQQADVLIEGAKIAQVGPVVWGMDTSNVDSVWVAGKAKKRDGKLLDVDLKKIGEQAAASRDYVVTTSGFQLPNI